MTTITHTRNNAGFPEARELIHTFTHEGQEIEAQIVKTSEYDTTTTQWALVDKASGEEIARGMRFHGMGHLKHRLKTHYGIEI